jgi:DNA modification methylase
MQTKHRFYFDNSKNMAAIPSGSVDLVVTSPPYPMIEMWDDTFRRHDYKIDRALARNNGPLAFELMHCQLDAVWHEVLRILKTGGILCINVGDAARTMGGNFALFPNHARILDRLLKLGLAPLPLILWRKQTNAPNKFMGSGMLPAGAYVTLEHEYILILRKGPKREFRTAAEKQLRNESAIFWEERNIWYSDVWLDLKGTTQKMIRSSRRSRSAAFPFEIPYRLVNMFSVKGDMIVDPFLGTGTTVRAAMAAGRSSIGYEYDPALRKEIIYRMNTLVHFSNERISDRIKEHQRFVRRRSDSSNTPKYNNIFYQFPVMTRQETTLFYNPLEAVAESGKNEYNVIYSPTPQLP